MVCRGSGIATPTQPNNDYFAGHLSDHYLTDEHLHANLKELEAFQPAG